MHATDKMYGGLRLALFAVTLHLSLAADCVVSEWSVWSECYGSCEFAQQVRNRDVLRPPLPLQLGATVQPCPNLYATRFCQPLECPTARPLSAEQTATEKDDLAAELHRIMKKPTEAMLTALEDKLDTTSTVHLEDLMTTTMPKTLERARLRDMEQGFLNKLTVLLPKGNAVEQKDNNLPDALLTDVLAQLESTHTGESFDDRAIRKALKKNKKLMQALVEAVKSKTTTVPPPSDDVMQSMESFPQPSDLSSSYELEGGTLTPVETETQTPPTDTPATTVEPVTEAATETQPAAVTAPTTVIVETTELTTTTPSPTTITREMEGERIVNKVQDIIGIMTGAVMRREQERRGEVDEGTDTSPAPSQMEEEQLLSAGGQEIGPPPETPMELEVVDTGETSTQIVQETTKTEKVHAAKTHVEATTENPDASTVDTRPTWKPHSGYVPNTRRHAADITDKLYMTHEIVQDMSLEPIRRAPEMRIECLENKRCCRVERQECPDGSRPRYVKRFYKPMNSDACVPYMYPRCSQALEMEERPIKYEPNCQDVCFDGPEKNIDPLYSIINPDEMFT